MIGLWNKSDGKVTMLMSEKQQDDKPSDDGDGDNDSSDEGDMSS